jgi:hypothetical protein
MGREILYVVETDLGHVRVLEHGASAAHAAGDPVKIGFSPDDSLVFYTATESLMGDGERGGLRTGHYRHLTLTCKRIRGRTYCPGAAISASIWGIPI